MSSKVLSNILSFNAYSFKGSDDDYYNRGRELYLVIYFIFYRNISIIINNNKLNLHLKYGSRINNNYYYYHSCI
jgi:hypothetical protein